MIKTIIEKLLLIISLYFGAYDMAFSCQNISLDDCEFPQMPTPMIVWIHVGNSDTSAVINNFKKESGNVRIKEILSLEELNRFINFLETQKISSVVTEMGFWEDELHYRFNKTAGISAMEKINETLPHLKGKFVISARVGRNEDLLLDISKAHFFRHTTMFSPIYDLFPCVSMREKELDLCLKTLRNSLFSKPVYCKGALQEDVYPINHFEIEKIFDVEHETNAREFLDKQAEFIQHDIPSEWEWGFHGSSSKDATYNIAKINFSMKYLGQNSGNRGAYGEGLYFGRRGYLHYFLETSLILVSRLDLWVLIFLNLYHKSES